MQGIIERMTDEQRTALLSQWVADHEEMLTRVGAPYAFDEGLVSGERTEKNKIAQRDMYIPYIADPSLCFFF